MYTGFRGRYPNFRKGLNMMVNEELLKLITGRVIDKITKYNAFKIPVGVSNRHVHVTSEDLETLFGKGYQLTKKSDLKQPGQYACNETVTIRGPKGEFERVRILGPVRKQSQIEISKTDSFRLGVKAPIRESGDLVEVETFGERHGVFGDVLIRVSEQFELEMHVDVDEANACALKNNDYVIIRR